MVAEVSPSVGIHCGVNGRTLMEGIHVHCLSCILNSQSPLNVIVIVVIHALLMDLGN